MALPACIFSHKYVTFQLFTQMSITTLFFMQEQNLSAFPFLGMSLRGLL